MNKLTTYDFKYQTHTDTQLYMLYFYKHIGNNTQIDLVLYHHNNHCHQNTQFILKVIGLLSAVEDVVVDKEIN